ncbi:hypothetical protein [Parvibium lacunae]|uniref:Polysaccharide chain length determinant N-terminal domain-containing protein n=1 Tax=Parvibium lacunae TaxID=1888893 RepID=A0A368L0I4_9BURK|nr:hypothetical protein [Parvibium lacunae]RCS57059.1 hypothetical protein DU000_09640 [Parvibium lacunae]
MAATRDLVLSFTQLGAIAKARRTTILVAVFLCAAVSGAISVVIPKTYRASADIFIDYRANDPISGRQFHPMQDESYLETQFDMLKGVQVAERTIDKLRLLDSEEGRKLVALRGAETAKRLMAEGMAKSLDIVTHKTSRIIEVRYTGKDPKQVRDITNTLVKSYIDLTIELVMAPAQARRDQYNTQLESLRQQVDDLQTKLTEYQQESGILEVDEKQDTDTRQLNELSTRLAQTQGLRAETTARRAALEKLLQAGHRAYEIPTLSTLGNIPELKGRLSSLDAKLAETSAVYGRNHPRYREIIEERQALTERLEREARTILDSVRSADEQALRQEQILQQQINAQQQRTLENKKHRDIISSYQRQLESVQKIYNTALQRYDELLMSSNISIANSAVMRWAELPTKHIKPILLNNLVFGIFGGLVLGLSLAFLLELSNRRVRCLEDLQKEFELPVLGQVGGSKRLAAAALPPTTTMDPLWGDDV